MKLLLTGFEPFGGREVNSSWQLVQKINLTSLEIKKQQVPVDYNLAWASLAEAAGEADVVVCVGESSKAQSLQFEWDAQNIQDATIADNSGALLGHKIIEANQPQCLISQFDKSKVLSFFSDQPSWSLSYYAGTYVCNRLYFDGLNAFEGTGKKVAFVHCPLFDKGGEQVLSLDHAAEALSEFLEALALGRI